MSMFHILRQQRKQCKNDHFGLDCYNSILSIVAGFTESAAPFYTEVIDFNALGSSDLDGTIISHHWDFGDGNDIEPPIHSC